MARQIKAQTGPEYRVLEKSYIDGVLAGPGEKVETVTYYGLPGKNLDPINDEAQAVVKQAEAIEKAFRQGKLSVEQRQAARTSLSDELNEVNPDRRSINVNYDEPLSDEERKVLEKHAAAAMAADAKKPAAPAK